MVLEVSESARHWPEVAMHLEKGVPACLVHLWHSSRDRSYYDSCEPLCGTGRDGRKVPVVTRPGNSVQKVVRRGTVTIVKARDKL